MNLSFHVNLFFLQIVMDADDDDDEDGDEIINRYRNIWIHSFTLILTVKLNFTFRILAIQFWGNYLKNILCQLILFFQETVYIFNMKLTSYIFIYINIEVFEWAFNFSWIRCCCCGCRLRLVSYIVGLK